LWSATGWVVIAFLDVWAGVDVFARPDESGDGSKIVDPLGSDTMVTSPHTSLPDLFALIAGVLVLFVLFGLLTTRSPLRSARFRGILISLGLASVGALASGGHLFALLVPVGLLIGALSGLSGAPQQLKPPPHVAASAAIAPGPARRPSPRPRPSV
jgi:hypothetical protein